MGRKPLFLCVFLLTFATLFFFNIPSSEAVQRVNSRSAILIDMQSGSVLFEQNADLPIAPASITKILTLYLVFEAIKEGHVRLSDSVEISQRAASTGGSRMGLRAGTRVPLEELIKGMAVVSGNDACVAVAEHISGSTGRFVQKMNAKARQLGMTNSRFLTPNGLPAPKQLTTARDVAKLSIAYLRRFPESLAIHSMQQYAYGRSSHHNANRLLGRCPGVDGLKTGFVCSSGYNISATAKRNGVRILAVVMGTRTPWIRLTETEKLIEAGFRECGSPRADVKYVSGAGPAGEVRTSKSSKNSRPARVQATARKKSGAASALRSKDKAKSSSRVVKSSVGQKSGKRAKVNSRQPAAKKTASASGRTRSGKAGKKVLSRGGHQNSKSDRPHVVKKKSGAKKTGKSVRSAKSSKKQKTSTASTGKKTSGEKPASQAHDLKKKPRG